MMKSKKGLSGILAVLMLVSMLSCFALPVTAEDAWSTTLSETGNYYIRSAKEWNTMAAEINADVDANGTNSTAYTKTIYIQNDIDFTGVVPTKINQFKGKLDGKGYKFTNISTSTALIEKLFGTVRDLTLDATCTFDGGSTANFGPFAHKFSGTIARCVSYATVTGTGNLGYFVGESTSGGTIKGCVATGTIGKFDATEAATVQYCYPHATITDVYEAVWTINKQIETDNVQNKIRYLNVDALGVPCLGDENNRVVKLTIREEGEEDQVSYHAPRMRYSENSVGFIQNEIEVGKEGKEIIVTGAQARSNTVYVDNRDIVVEYCDVKYTKTIGETTYTYPAQGEIESDIARLRTTVAAYEAMDLAYFTAAFEQFRTDWIDGANAALAEAETFLETAENFVEKDIEEKEIARINALIALEEKLDDTYDNAKSVTGYGKEESNPENYPSIDDYETYRYAIKEYKIEDADDWMKAVELTNNVTNPDAYEMSGVTLHLVADIDMKDYTGDDPLLPLGYGWVFDGNLNGHNHSFINFNMEIDSSYGPVGLIGVISKTAKRIVQNVSIASGSIKVTGAPRHKSSIKLSSSENVVGGIVGKSFTKNTLIRKCLNNADISVEFASRVGGILGDGQIKAVIDSCINNGKNNQYGILGYGAAASLVYNTMSSATDTGMMKFTAGITGITEENQDTLTYAEAEATIKTYFINSYGVRLTYDLYPISGVDKDKQVEIQRTYNTNNDMLSDAAAGWKVNANYVRETSFGDGKRVYYTLDATGHVAFGEKANQIYRIKMVCDEHGESCEDHPVRYAFGIPGQTVELNFDISANYYASEDKNVTIEKNAVTIGENTPLDANVKANENTIIVYVGCDADRGNVNGKGNIDVLDVLDAVRMSVGKMDKNMKAADVDNNHKVDVNDAYLIIRRVLKGVGSFEEGKTAESEEDYIKIASYNIKGLRNDPYQDPDGNDGVPLSRLDAVVSELKSIDADVVGLQELLEGTVTIVGQSAIDLIYTELNKQVGDDYVAKYSYCPRATAGGYAGSGIISKYPIVDYDEEENNVPFKGLGQMDDASASLDGPSTTPRGFSWYKIDVDDGGYTPYKDEDGRLTGSQDIIVYNCHLTTVSDKDSSAELAYMIQYMKEKHLNDRVVFTGDFNLGAYKMEKVIEKMDASDVITALNGGANFDGYTKTNPRSGSMVDNIFVSNEVEYFDFSQSDSAASAVHSSTNLYGYNTNHLSKVEDYYKDNSTFIENLMGAYQDDIKNAYSYAYDEEFYNGKAWTASDHLAIWAYIKKVPSQNSAN